MSILCKICGEPMPKGEEVFQYHGYSGPCPKPPLSLLSIQEALAQWFTGWKVDLQDATPIGEQFTKALISKFDVAFKDEADDE